MINIFKIWFGNLSKTKKVLFIVIALLVLVILIQSGRLARSEYLRLKTIEKEYKEYKEAVDASEAKELEIVTENKNKTVKISSKNESINKKLEQDEKIIDNDSVSDDDLYDFITKHENQDR